HNVTAINNEGLRPVQQLALVRQAVLQTRIDALADEMLGDGVEHQAYQGDLVAVDAAMAAYTSSNDTTGAKGVQVKNFTTAWASYHLVVSGQLLTLARAKDWVAYTQLRDSQVKPAADAFNKALTALETDQAASATAQVATAHHAVSTARLIIGVLLVVGSLAALGLAWLIARAVIG